MTNGLRLFRLGGAGPKVLLLHGFGADRMTWLANQDALLQANDVFVCDLPAHGGQTAIAGTATISTIVDQLIYALDPWNERFALIGHSLGGALAIELAARRPDLVTALALIAPAGLGNGIDCDFLNTFSTLSEMDSALELLRRLVARPRLITPQIAQRVLEHLEQPGVRPALRILSQQLADIEMSIKPYVGAVVSSDLPKMIIWGESDQINPFDPTKLATFGDQILALPETGHLPHIETSRTVNGYLTNFLAASAY